MPSTRNLTLRTALWALAVAFGMSAAASAAVTNVRQQPALAEQATRTRSVYVLHTFTGADGSTPEGNLDLALSASGNNFVRTVYGETEGGGTALSGTIFRFTLGANAFTSLYSFSGGNDGSVPLAGLAANDSQYFLGGSYQGGVTVFGGASGQGTLFAIGMNGKPLLIHSFTGGADGGSPAGRLTRFTDGNFYGTTSNGGVGFGTVYKVTPNGQFSTIYTFTGGVDGGSPQAGLAARVNLNGYKKAARTTPVSALVNRIAASSDVRFVSPYLYGVTSTAGKYGSGTIFRITPTGQLQTLHAFSGGNDGGAPTAKLSTDLDGNLYGTASVGGSGGNGVVFKIPHGTNKPRVIYDFGNGATGASPSAQITLALNGNLYGTTTSGGASGQFGTIFEITSGGVFSDIHDFLNADGATPQGALLDGGDGYLYGTTTAGGAMSSGVLYSIAQ